MDCSGFENILADFQEGKLSPHEQSASERHLEGCARCRRLLDIVRGNVDILPATARDEFAHSILECTSGPVCGGIESRLCSFVEGGLGKEQSRLIALHLEHCNDCKSIAAELEELRDVLPTMAEIQPDESFTREVVRLAGERRYHRGSLANRLLTWWNCVVQRPRFSLEAAYVGTLVVVFLFSVPSLPLRNFATETAPAKIQPATSRLVAISENTKTPVTNGLKTIETTAALHGQAVSKFLSTLGQKCARASVSMTGTCVQGLKKWNRKKASTLVSIWKRWAGRNSSERP